MVSLKNISETNNIPTIISYVNNCEKYYVANINVKKNNFSLYTIIWFCSTADYTISDYDFMRPN